jgi:hypothetical protein
MKRYCFNYEDCGWVEYINEEDIKDIDFKNVFFSCPECKSIAALVKNDFHLSHFEEQEPIVSLEEDEDDF